MSSIVIVIEKLVSSQYQGGRVMKVRFGFTCRGQADLTLDAFPQLVDDLERLGFDSLWLPEHMLNGPLIPSSAWHTPPHARRV